MFSFAIDPPYFATPPCFSSDLFSQVSTRRYRSKLTNTAHMSAMYDRALLLSYPYFQVCSNNTKRQVDNNLFTCQVIVPQTHFL